MTLKIHPSFAQILYQDEAPCPKYDQMYNKFLYDPDPQTDFYEYNQRSVPLYTYLSESTGEVSQFRNCERINLIRDGFAECDQCAASR